MGNSRETGARGENKLLARVRGAFEAGGQWAESERGSQTRHSTATGAKRKTYQPPEEKDHVPSGEQP